MNKLIAAQNQYTFRRILSERELDDIYRLRYDVYCVERGYIKSTKCANDMERDKYDRFSAQFAAEDHGELIGTSRLVLDNPYGFPIEKYCKDKLYLDINSFDRRRIAEISRLVIKKDCRMKRISDASSTENDPSEIPSELSTMISSIPITFGLYLAMYRECDMRGITHCIALMEKSLWQLATNHEFILRPIGEEVDVYGAVRPYILEVAQAETVLL